MIVARSDDGRRIPGEFVAEEARAERAAHLPAASGVEAVHNEQHEVHQALQRWARREHALARLHSPRSTEFIIVHVYAGRLEASDIVRSSNCWRSAVT
jgi:hypothetical protein